MIWVYAILAALLVGAGSGYYVASMHYEKIIVSDRAEMKQALADQKEKDDKDAQDALGDLNDQIALLRSVTGAPPVVRLCSNPSQVRKPAGTGSAPSGSPTTGAVPEMPDGSRAGPDVGPGLQGLALSCELETSRLRALQQWAKGLQ